MNNTSLRVLHVIPSNARLHGGPSRALSLMEKELAAQGLQVVTATTDDDGPGRHNGKPLGKPLYENSVTRWYFRKQIDFYKTSLGLGWWALRRARDFDVVHIHALFTFSTLVAAWSARMAGVPYIIRPLGTLNRYGMTQRRPRLKKISLALFEGPALRHAAAVHFTSEDERSDAAQCGVAMRGVVIPLGIEAVSVADAALASAGFSGLGKGSYILFVGRLNPVKNVEGLLRAFREIAAHWPTLRLLIAGDGAPDYVAQLKALARALDVADQVVWAGHVGDEAKGSLLAGAIAFVLPSFSENFGIAAAEALMAGLPCVLGQGVAIAQDVVDAGAGIAVLPDPASIAAGLMRVLADAQVRVDMSARAVALAQDKYSAQAMGKNLVALYEDILGGHQPGASKTAGISR